MEAARLSPVSMQASQTGGNTEDPWKAQEEQRLGAEVCGDQAARHRRIVEQDGELPAGGSRELLHGERDQRKLLLCQGSFLVSPKGSV